MSNMGFDGHGPYGWTAKRAVQSKLSARMCRDYEKGLSAFDVASASIKVSSPEVLLGFIDAAVEAYLHGEHSVGDLFGGADHLLRRIKRVEGKVRHGL